MVKTLQNWSLRMSATIGLTSTMGEPVSLEREYACCVTLLAFDQSPMVFCRVFSNDVFHKLLVTLSVYLLGFFLDDLVSFPVFGLIRCFGQSPCPIFSTILPIQVVVEDSFTRTHPHTHTHPSFTRTHPHTHTHPSFHERSSLAYQLSLGFVNPPRRESDSRGVVSLLPTVTTPFCLCIPVNPVTQNRSGRTSFGGQSRSSALENFQQKARRISTRIKSTATIKVCCDCRMTKRSSLNRVQCTNCRKCH